MGYLIYPKKLFIFVKKRKNENENIMLYSLLRYIILLVNRYR